MEILIILIFILIFGLILLGARHNHKVNLETRRKNLELLQTVSDINRGTWAERELVLELLKNDIPAGAIFHDLYLKKSNGKFSQIDLVVATKVGIIVFEVKDYSGWLFGKGNQTNWTQLISHRYGRTFYNNKYRFYNPIMQNNKHIEELKKHSAQFNNIPFYSIIVFYGNCELRDVSIVPKGTFVTKSERILEVLDSIINDNAPATYTDKHEIIRILKTAVANGDDPNNQDKHAEDVRDFLGKERVFN